MHSPVSHSPAFTSRVVPARTAAQIDRRRPAGSLRRAAPIALLLLGLLWSLGLPAPAHAAGASIAGTVFADHDRDGVRDADDQTFADHLLYLFDGAGAFVAQTRSGPDGSYGFSGLAPGSYTVTTAAPTWQDLRSDWVPTTSGTLLPDHVVTVGSGTTTRDLGWREIVRSTDVYAPISRFTGPEGLRVSSYNDVVSAQQLHEHVVSEFLVGDEAASTRIRFGLGDTNSAQAAILRSDGAITGVAVTVSTSYERWLLGGDHTLAHEYGHAWTHYHNSYVNQDLDGRWARYLTARGVDPDDDRLGTSHAWQPAEIAAEDYRQLFTSENARSGAQFNRHLPPPTEIPGFADWVRETFTRAPVDGSEPADDGDEQPTDDPTTAPGPVEPVVEPVEPVVEPLVLDVDTRKVRGVNHATLRWAGATGAVDVYRDDRRVATTSGAGYDDATGLRGAPRVTYRVCSATTCSASVTVQF